eukprot:6483665-Amphidinium_carterae.1
MAEGSGAEWIDGWHSEFRWESTQNCQNQPCGWNEQNRRRRKVEEVLSQSRVRQKSIALHHSSALNSERQEANNMKAKTLTHAKASLLVNDFLVQIACTPPSVLGGVDFLQSIGKQLNS